MSDLRALTEGERNLFLRYYPSMGPRRFHAKYFPQLSLSWVRKQALNLEVRFNDHYNKGYVPMADAAAYLGICGEALWRRVNKDYSERKTRPGFVGNSVRNEIYIASRVANGVHRSLSEAYIEELDVYYKEGRRAKELEGYWLEPEQVAATFGITTNTLKSIYQRAKKNPHKHPEFPGYWIKDIPRVLRTGERRARIHLYDPVATEAAWKNWRAARDNLAAQRHPVSATTGRRLRVATSAVEDVTDRGVSSPCTRKKVSVVP